MELIRWLKVDWDCSPLKYAFECLCTCARDTDKAYVEIWMCVFVCVLLPPLRGLSVCHLAAQEDEEDEEARERAPL